MGKLKDEELRKGGFLIAKIRELSERIFTKILRDFNISEITAAQGRVLFPLWQVEEISFQELKKKAMLSKATLSYMLNKLEEAGYIQRVPVDNDKRTFTIKLTKKKEALQDKFFQVSNEMRDIYYRNFAEHEINDFENYLRKLLSNLIEFSEKDKQ